MFLAVWNYIRGYVIIEVYGFSVERFMNLAVHKGIYLWDVDKTGATVSMKVSLKGFKLLRSCSKKTKCKIKIKQKVGLPFIAFKYRKRNILAFGALFFIFILFFLSSFIWLIEIEGNDRVATEDIQAFIEARGLQVGNLRRNINAQDIQKGLIVEFQDISWINIEISGTKATIRLTEIIPKQQILDTSIPCDIIAREDGLITSIITSAGRPLVRQNDVVRRGDILVSSELISETEEDGIVTEFVHAIAEVRAKMYYEINFHVPIEYTEKIYTGNTRRDRYLLIFDRTVNLMRPNVIFENYDRVLSRRQISLGENYPIPLLIITSEYREFQIIERSRTLEEAEELANRIITERIIREFDFEADIVDKQVTFTESEGGLDVNAIITTIERIDVQRPIDLPEDLTDIQERNLTDDGAEEGNTNTQ